MQVKNQQLELDMEQQTGSNVGKEYVKAVYCRPAYSTYMQMFFLEFACFFYDPVMLTIQSLVPLAFLNPA